MDRRRWLVVGALTACVQGAYGPDWISFARWGIFPILRPQAAPRPVLGVHSERFDEGQGIEVAVSLQGAYPTARGSSPLVMKSSAYRYRASATIETAAGEALPLGCRWRWLGGPERGCVATLPPLPDGDHTLRVTVDSPMPAEASVEIPLPYYAPAQTHLLTDRPQYSAGDTLLARTLTYARADLRPVADRPGTWTLLRGRDSTVLFREVATADDWGVATLSLALPETMPDGHYTLRWESGDAVAEQHILVEDVEMPWLLVDAAPAQGWFAPGEAPVFSGTVQTADGRPAADAEVTATVSVTGGWPPPTAWAEPAALRTDRDGRFTLALSEIPHDLRAPETLAVHFQAQDQTGMISTGTVTAPISPDTMRVAAVTAADGRLIESRSNRVYLRLTTPDGRPLAGETATIESDVDARDAGREATTDADGVLMVQLDPGPAMALIDPPRPVREQPAKTDTFSLAEGRALLDDRVLSLAERDALAGMLPDLDRTCGQLIGTEGTTARLVSASNGRLDSVTPQRSALDACVADVLEGRPWPTDGGLWQVSLAEAPDPSRPRLRLRFDAAGQASDPVKAAMEGAAARAGACFRDAEASVETLGYVRWHLGAEQERPRVWFSPELPGCVQEAFAGLSVPAARTSGQGAVWLSLEVPRAAPPARPEPRVQQGWRYRVRVGDRVGYWTTKSVHSTASAIRATEPIIDPGEPITIVPVSGWHTPGVMTLHGPGGWSQRCPRADADLSEMLHVQVSPDCPEAPERGWRFQPPEESGFYWTRDHGTAFAYVRPAQPATLSISADQDAYAPGEAGTLSIETGGPAVVSLVGHDERLARVLALPGPEDLQAAMLPFDAQRTFGAFTLLDLVSGRVRGEAAALAILTELTKGTDTEAERPSSSSFTDVYEPSIGPQTAASVASVAFAVQAALRAPPLGPLSYEAFAEAWDAEVDRQGAQDAWGRPLRLSVVPDELVSKIDPRVLAGDATRFPEHIEPWSSWFARSHR